jgi:hypothetical protein
LKKVEFDTVKFSVSEKILLSSPSSSLPALSRDLVGIHEILNQVQDDVPFFQDDVIFFLDTFSLIVSRIQMTKLKCQMKSKIQMTN